MVTLLNGSSLRRDKFQLSIYYVISKQSKTTHICFKCRLNTFMSAIANTMSSDARLACELLAVNNRHALANSTEERVLD
jgi:hypothetical protein